MDKSWGEGWWVSTGWSELGGPGDGVGVKAGGLWGECGEPHRVATRDLRLEI